MGAMAMTLEHEAAVNELTIRALDATEHPDKAASLLMTGAMRILQRRFGAELAIEHMSAALDIAGGNVRAAIHGAAGRGN